MMLPFPFPGKPPSAVGYFTLCINTMWGLELSHDRNTLRIMGLGLRRYNLEGRVVGALELFLNQRMIPNNDIRCMTDLHVPVISDEFCSLLNARTIEAIKIRIVT